MLTPLPRFDTDNTWNGGAVMKQPTTGWPCGSGSWMEEPTKVLVGIPSVTMKELLMPNQQPLQPGFHAHADPTPEDKEPPNATRNAKRIAILEKLVRGMTKQVKGLTQQVKVLMEARQGH